MAANKKGNGDTLTYTNTGSAISAGDVVVIGNVVGIALVDIAATTGVGEVAITGEWEIVKVTGAVIGQGETVYWDVSAGDIDDNAATAASGDVKDFGIATEAAGSGVLLCNVRLNPGAGSVEP